jgi:hypothetical protein
MSQFFRYDASPTTLPSCQQALRRTRAGITFPLGSAVTNCTTALMRELRNKTKGRTSERLSVGAT